MATLIQSSNLAVHAVFDAGTRTSFNQTAAPTGWTKDTTAALHDTAMRIVTGTVGSGGANAFSSAAYTPTISGSVAGYALQVADIPSHLHNISALGCIAYGAPAVNQAYGAGASSGGLVPNTGYTGGGGSHAHGVGSLVNSTITLGIKYNDFIIATKN